MNGPIFGAEVLQKIDLGGSSNSGIDHAAKWIKIHRVVHKNHCYFGVEMNADSM